MTSVTLFFLLYSIASFLLSVVLISLLPEKYRKRKYLGVFLLTLLNVCVVFVGFIGSLILVFYLLKRQREIVRTPVEEVNLYESLGEFPVVKRIFGEGFVSELIENKNISKDIRLKGLILVSDLKEKKGMRLIKKALLDQEEEIRFFSFNIINKLERNITLQIHVHLKRLEEEKDEFKQALIHRELAKLYWEIVYFELSDVEIRHYLISESERHALKALESLNDDVSLSILLGKIGMIKREYENALEYFLRAMELGALESRVVPYLAEISFIKKDFKKVKELLSKYLHLKLDPLLYPIVLLWEG